MSTLVLGLGNPDRGDDAVGLVVAERLAGRNLAATVRAWSGPDIDLLDLWPDVGHLVVVDAVRSGGAAGTIHRFTSDDRRGGRPRGAGGSHAFGLLDVIELGRRLGRGPQRWDIYLVEVATTSHGEALSGGVAAAAIRLVESLAWRLGGAAAGAAAAQRPAAG